ncbi:MAG: hypothetical protein AAF609_08460 [Cyanobacteria bacterium P01_C01_bin.120]
MENSTSLTSDILELRVLIDAEMRRLGWHWKHPRIQAWLQRVSAVVKRPCTIVADLDDAAMYSLLAHLRAEPNQLELGDGYE